MIERMPGIDSVETPDGLIVGNMVSGSLCALNATASAVWRSIATPASLDDIATALRAQFDVDAERSGRAVSDLIDTWRTLGIVRIVD